MSRITILILFILILSSSAYAGQKEKVYQDKWCTEHKGIAEYRLNDGARVDCLTEEFAVEFDFAHKWAEAVGQALFYGEMTGKKPMVVLIKEGRNDNVFISRLLSISRKHGITVETMEVSDEKITCSCFDYSASGRLRGVQNHCQN